MEVQDRANPDQNATLGYFLINTFKGIDKGNRGIFQIDTEENVTKVTTILDIERSKMTDKEVFPNDFCSMNIWALTPKTLDLLGQRLEKFKQENKGTRAAESKIELEISALLEENRIQVKLYPTHTSTIGITYPEDVEKVREILSNNS